MSTVKTKRVLAGLCAASMLFVTACSKDEPAENAAGTTAASTTSATSKSASSSKTEKAEETSETSKGEPTDPAAPEITTMVPADPPAPVVPPLPGSVSAPDQGEIDVPEMEPVANGRPATPEEVEALTAMLKRQEEQTMFHGYMNTFVNSLCTELIEENGGREAYDMAGVPDFPLNADPSYAANATKLTGVNNMVVDGDTASADVSNVTGAGVEATHTWRFRKEQGDWKLCK